MRSVVLMVAFALGLITPATAQKANIEVANAKWMEFFNEGDFSKVLPRPRFRSVRAALKGQAAIGAMWKSALKLEKSST